MTVDQDQKLPLSKEQARDNHLIAKKKFKELSVYGGVL